MNDKIVQYCSRRAIDMIEKFEIGDTFSYVSTPSWPGGASGITIGVGYDLGYASAAQIEQDWHFLAQKCVSRLQSYSGRTGILAKSLLYSAKDINIVLLDAQRVFETRDIPRANSVVNTVFQNTDSLSSDSFGALTSLIFNRGAGMSDTKPGNRLEMRQIRDAMIRADFDKIPGFIRSMKRLWQDSGLDGLLARRDAEADLFEAGLHK